MTLILSLEEAAHEITDSNRVAFGGMTLYRRPTAFVKALLRRQQPPHQLTLLSFTCGYEADLLIGAGCVATVRTCYFGLEAFGFAPMFTQAAQQGKIRILEETESSLVMGLRARMAGVGFLPSQAWQGTDLPRLRPDVQTMIDVYTGRLLTAFPALALDVTVLHGLEADKSGNVRLNNNIGIDLELAYVASKVIVTVERLVDQLAPSTDGPILPAPGADIIALAPRGAWPTSCYPLYPIGGGELLRYIDACNAGQFGAYLAEALQN